MIDQLHSACAPLCYARKSLTPGKLGEAIAALVVGIAWEGGRYLGELRIREFERFESWKSTLERRCVQDKTFDCTDYSTCNTCSMIALIANGTPGGRS